MRRYQTEVLVPPDRFIGIQLPPHLPEGRATVTVIVREPEPAEFHAVEAETDRQDIEWWEEFDEGSAAGEP